MTIDRETACATGRHPNGRRRGTHGFVAIGDSTGRSLCGRAPLPYPAS